MSRAAVALVLLLASPAAAQTRPAPGRLGALLRMAYTVLSLPYAYSRRKPAEGFTLAPYADGETGDVGDENRLWRVEPRCHRTGDDAGGCGLRARVDDETHVGLDAAWTRYRERGAADLDYLTAAARGDALREDDVRLEYRFGLSGVAGRLNRPGGLAGLELESYPLRPLRFDAGLTAAFLDGGTLGDFSAGASYVGGRLESRLGWRLLTGPLPDLSGPEFSLTWRF